VSELKVILAKGCYSMFLIATARWYISCVSIEETFFNQAHFRRGQSDRTHADEGFEAPSCHRHRAASVTVTVTSMPRKAPGEPS
jgi:hypothetical protein